MRFYKFMIIVFNFFTMAYLFPAYADNVASTHFISIADIHFDPFIACYNVAAKPCPLIQQLRETPTNKWAAIFSENEKLPSQYRQDTNYPLLASALAASKKMVEKNNSKFVVVLGDFLGHDYREFYKKYSGDKSFSGYQLFVKKTLEFLTIQLNQTFPSIDVYSVIGNNDGDRGDYFSDPNGKFYHEVADLWSQLIKNNVNRNKMQQSFKSAAYYSVELPGPSNLRLIVLNSVMFSNKAKGPNVNQAAEKELNWLHSELQHAKAKQQKVLIAMHIPIGIDVYTTLRLRLFTLVEMWQKKYSQRFQAELQQFYPEIAGVFAGHLHSDWFQILTFPNGEIPVSGTPSVSPIFGNNPGFKTFSYSNQKQQLEDYATYYYSLATNHEWDLEYDFNQIYQIGCQNCSIIHGMTLLQQTGLLANYYKCYYAVGTESQPITTKWDPYYWCAIRQINTGKYQECIK